MSDARDDVLDGFRLTDRVAVVTGGGSGIGQASAELFAGAGAKVVVGDLDQATAQATAAAITETGGGSIINVAGSIIDITAPKYGPYAISQQAVTQLTRTLAMESGRYGIRVNAIAPGATVTNFTKRHLYDDDGNFSQEKYDRFVKAQERMSPLGLSGDPLDQANLMLYLAAPASRWSTGQTWRGNGGQVFAT